MNAIQIVADYLKAKGYDGLVSHGDECGCELNDLHPCDQDFASCQPAYKYQAADDPDYDWVMNLEKPK